MKKILFLNLIILFCFSMQAIEIKIKNKFNKADGVKVIYWRDTTDVIYATEKPSFLNRAIARAKTISGSMGSITGSVTGRTIGSRIGSAAGRPGGYVISVAGRVVGYIIGSTTGRFAGENVDDIIGINKNKDSKTIPTNIINPIIGAEIIPLKGKNTKATLDIPKGTIRLGFAIIIKDNETYPLVEKIKSWYSYKIIPLPTEEIKLKIEKKNIVVSTDKKENKYLFDDEMYVNK